MNYDEHQNQKCFLIHLKGTLYFLLIIQFYLKKWWFNSDLNYRNLFENRVLDSIYFFKNSGIVVIWVFLQLNLNLIVFTKSWDSKKFPNNKIIESDFVLLMSAFYRVSRKLKNILVSRRKLVSIINFFLSFNFYFWIFLCIFLLTFNFLVHIFNFHFHYSMILF
jgi:hypothetical protein